MKVSNIPRTEEQWQARILEISDLAKSFCAYRPTLRKCVPLVIDQTVTDLDLFDGMDTRSNHEISRDRKSSAIKVRDAILSTNTIDVDSFSSQEPDRKQRKTLKTLLCRYLPKSVFSGDKIKYSSVYSKHRHNYSKLSGNALNNRYFDIHDGWGNTFMTVFDCDGVIPVDFAWGDYQPFMIVTNPVSKHSHICYVHDRKTKIQHDTYRNNFKRIRETLRSMGLTIGDKPVLRMRSPLLNPVRRDAYEVRDGRNHAEADFHVTNIFNVDPMKLEFILKSAPKLKTPRKAKGTASGEPYSLIRSMADVEKGGRHNHMLAASHDERFSWLRKFGAITVDEAFDIYKKYSSDLKDSDVMADARCFAHWAERNYTGNTLGQGDWFNGMYLNVPLNEVRQRGWNNYRENNGETKKDCSERTGLPYWKIKEQIKTGLRILNDGFYKLVSDIIAIENTYRDSLTTNATHKQLLSTNSGDEENHAHVEMTEFEALSQQSEPMRMERPPPKPPDKDYRSLSTKEMFELLEG